MDRTHYINELSRLGIPLKVYEGGSLQGGNQLFVLMRNDCPQDRYAVTSLLRTLVTKDLAVYFSVDESIDKKDPVIWEFITQGVQI